MCVLLFINDLNKLIPLEDGIAINIGLRDGLYVTDCVYRYVEVKFAIFFHHPFIMYKLLCCWVLVHNSTN